MKNSIKLVAAAICAVLFAGVIWLGASLSPEQTDQAQSGDAGIVISEVMSRNDLYPDADGRLLDYVELHNPTANPVDISQYKLSDKGDTIGYTFPQGTVIEPGAYLVCRCDPEGDGDVFANFRISGDGETVYLYNSANVCVQRIDVPALPVNQPYIRAADGTWSVGSQATPGFANTDEGYSLWLTSMGIVPMNVVISELQSDSGSAWTDSRGQLCDWLELYNAGTEPAVLDGCFLSNDPENLRKWQISQLTLQPGEYRVIPCTGREAAGEANFALSKNGVSVYLTGPVGNPMTELTCPALEQDWVWQLTADGSYLPTQDYSPGYPNTAEGHKAYIESRQLPALAIWEVMPANDRYLIQSDGESYDWVELKNISSQTINLSDYAISDDGNVPNLFPLPDQQLAPSETVVIILSGDTELTGRYIHAPFALNRSLSWLYVADTDGAILDSVRVQDVPLLGSAGRMDGQNGLYYFATPTPGKENTGGYAETASAPFVDTPGGIYNDVAQVRVVLSGEGQIRYTTDGSEPTANSALYEQPLILTKTTTLRAKCFATDKLPSETVTTGYIINENHTLPVVSVAVDPEEMFGYSGIYTQYYWNVEIPCNVTLYEESGSFSIDCGIKMFGHTGLEMAKKSFKINFRGGYGQDLLTYPVYGEDGPEVYDSLIIRSGQDYPQSIFRDELFTSLCRQMSDNVLAQRDKFCILYINGSYRGIYCIKEAFGEMYYAQNRGVSAESVEIFQAPVYPDTDVYRFMNYLASHDMTDPDNYAYACSVMDMESLIDWMIIQGYSTNGDVQQNLRYFRSSENGNRLEMAFYDLDWAFYYHLPFTDILSNDREMNWQHLRITTRLIRNPDFRKLFLERLSYHMENTLSNENVLARIDYYEQLLAPEVARERERWGGWVGGWEWQVQKLRNFITERDHLNDIIWRLVRYIGLTQAEIDTYFWRWA